MKAAFTFLLRLMILTYQKIISPLFPPSCRYTLTCSSYSLQAISKYGPFKGLYLSLKRILNCHPWGGDDYESIP
jgi:hypothetical protein